jgi:hypothetical protein
MALMTFREFFMDRYRWRREELLAQLHFFGPDGPGEYRDGRMSAADATAALMGEVRQRLVDLEELRTTYCP